MCGLAAGATRNRPKIARLHEIGRKSATFGGPMTTSSGAYQIHTEARGPHWIAWITRGGESKPDRSIVARGRQRGGGQGARPPLGGTDTVRGAQGLQTRGWRLGASALQPITEAQIRDPRYARSSPSTHRARSRVSLCAVAAPVARDVSRLRRPGRASASARQLADGSATTQGFGTHDRGTFGRACSRVPRPTLPLRDQICKRFAEFGGLHVVRTVQVRRRNAFVIMRAEAVW